MHVGLPKTATTTLQTDFFPALEDERTRYLGVRQPRFEVEEQDALFRLLSSAVYGHVVPADARAALERELATGRTLLVSEEMFTVSEGRNSWRDRLARLAQVLEGVDHHVLLTVREPGGALFSRYVQLHERLSRRGTFLQCALEDEAMRVYHYRSLTDELFRHFARDRVSAHRFEDVVAGRTAGLLAALGCDAKRAGAAALGHHHKRPESSGAVVSEHRATLLDVVRRAVVAAGLAGRGRPRLLGAVVRPVSRLLGSVRLTRVAVPRPSEDDLALLRATLRDETRALDEHFGIRYD